MHGEVVGQGIVVGSIRFCSSTGVTFDVHDILLVPNCRRNPLSDVQLASTGLVVLGDTAGGGWRLVQDSFHLVVATNQRPDQSTQLCLDVTPLPLSSPPNVLLCHASILNTGTLSEWHDRLGHPSHGVIHRLLGGHLAHGGRLGSHSSPPGCPSCK